MAKTETPSWLSGADNDEDSGYKLTPTGTVTKQGINEPIGEEVPIPQYDEVALAGKG